MKRMLFGLLTPMMLAAQAKNADSLQRALAAAEEELVSLQQMAFRSKTEAERIEGNKRFIAVWEQVRGIPAILDYPFTLLKDVSILTSHDKRARIVTWNLHKDDGTHAYFGYVFVNNERMIKKGLFKRERQREFRSFRLVDRSATIRNPETHIGPPDKWFGMLYTQMIDCGDYYTLIGWDGNDKLTQRKFVDALYFRGDGTPVFGKDIFRFPRKNPRRLMFEYSSEVTMSLRFDPKSGRIIYSHLASRQEGELLEGQYQYYGPDGSFDALELKKGKWAVVEDVDARNEKNKNDNAPKPDPKKETPLYKPK